MITTDYVKSHVSTRTMLLQIVDAAITGLLLIALLIMSGGILYMLK